MDKHIENIKSNYKRLEDDIVTQLNLNFDIHHPTAGGNREKVWEDLFRRIVPKKFNVERTVFIIDSKGNCSKEVDIAIYDESYTPYIFNYGVMKFIPIEAVAAVLQCKSHITNSKGHNLKAWTESIDKLKTSDNAFVRTVSNIVKGSAPTQKATRPIKILCYMKELKKDTTQSDAEKGVEHFDIVMVAGLNKNTNAKKLNIFFSKNNETLWKIFTRYNFAVDDKDVEDDDLKGKYDENRELEKLKITENYCIEPSGEHNLLSFIFQFNQILMLINNPMFFPHMAYVRMFNDEVQSDKREKNN